MHRDPTAERNHSRDSRGVASSHHCAARLGIIKLSLILSVVLLVPSVGMGQQYSAEWMLWHPWVNDDEGDPEYVCDPGDTIGLKTKVRLSHNLDNAVEFRLTRKVYETDNPNPIYNPNPEIVEVEDKDSPKEVSFNWPAHEVPEQAPPHQYDLWYTIEYKLNGNWHLLETESQSWYVAVSEPDVAQYTAGWMVWKPWVNDHEGQEETVYDPGDTIGLNTRVRLVHGRDHTVEFRLTRKVYEVNNPNPIYYPTPQIVEVQAIEAIYVNFVWDHVTPTQNTPHQYDLFYTIEYKHAGNWHSLEAKSQRWQLELSEPEPPPGGEM